MVHYDPEELRQKIEEKVADVGVQAAIDQQQAQLDRNRDEGTWWAALMTLCQQRGQLAATAVAGHNLKLFLATRDPDDLVTLAAYLLHNTIHLISKYEEEYDLPLTVSKIVGTEHIMIFEKFAATQGVSCPECGNDDGWDGHPCIGDDEDEPVES